MKNRACNLSLPLSDILMEILWVSYHKQEHMSARKNCLSREFGLFKGIRTPQPLRFEPAIDTNLNTNSYEQRKKAIKKKAIFVFMKQKSYKLGLRRDSNPFYIASFLPIWKLWQAGGIRETSKLEEQSCEKEHQNCESNGKEESSNTYSPSSQLAANFCASAAKFVNRVSCAPLRLISLAPYSESDHGLNFACTRTIPSGFVLLSVELHKDSEQNTVSYTSTQGWR